MRVFFKVLLLFVITNTYGNINTQNLSTLDFDSLEFTLSKNNIKQLENKVNITKKIPSIKSGKNNKKITATTTVIKYFPVYIPIKIPVYKPVYVPTYIPVKY